MSKFYIDMFNSDEFNESKNKTVVYLIYLFLNNVYV